MSYRETITAYIKEDKEKGIDIDEMLGTIRESFPVGGWSISSSIGTVHDEYDNVNGPHDDRMLRFRANWVKWYDSDPAVKPVQDIFDKVIDEHPENIIYVRCGEGGEEEYCGDYGAHDIYGVGDETYFNPEFDPNIFEYKLKYTKTSDIERNIRIHAADKDEAEATLKKLMGVGRLRKDDIDIAEVAIRTEKIDKPDRGYNVGVEVLPSQTEQTDTYTYLTLTDVRKNEVIATQDDNGLNFYGGFSIDWDSIDDSI